MDNILQNETEKAFSCSESLAVVVAVVIVAVSERLL